MAFDIDHDYEFEERDGFRVIPDETKIVDGLYVLPNGRYMPSGSYIMSDGSTIIYEPRQLSPFADMLASCIEE